MKYLLDTHAFFRAAFQKEKLSASVKRVLEDTGNKVMVSRVSLWEIAIKYKVGKLPELKADLTQVVNELSKAGFRLLPIKNEHLIAYFNCSYFIEGHKDPFDRLLLVTAEAERAGFITKDEKFDAYKNRISIVW